MLLSGPLNRQPRNNLPAICSRPETLDTLLCLSRLEKKSPRLVDAGRLGHRPPTVLCDRVGRGRGADLKGPKLHKQAAHTGEPVSRRARLRDACPSPEHTS